MALLDVRDLSISFTGYGRTAQVLHGVSFSIAKGERVSLIGETGSGKSVTSKAIMGTLPENATIEGGRIAFDGLDLLALPPAERERLKGSDMSIIMQDPLSSFNPVFRIGKHLDDILRFADRRIGRPSGAQDRKRRIFETLRRVQLADADRVFDAWPHELSGGMRQRVLIALALLHKPRLLIADEPGTALDVTTQAEILKLINGLVDEEGLSLLMITHNLGVVRQTADRVLVMNKGEIVEQGPLAEVFGAPRDAYTRALMAAVPPLYGDRVENQPVSDAAPVLAMRDVSKVYRSGGIWARGEGHRAVSGVTFDVPEGEIFGIAGESGSGKTTVARMLMGLLDVTEGEVVRAPSSPGRRLTQIVYQNPGTSLNPKRTVAQTLAVPLGHIGMDRAAASARMTELMSLVKLPESYLGKYPHELSGGQKQRVSIARALAAEPKVLILDEPTSALDVSVQKTVIDLLLHLRAELGLTYVIISHDLSLMRNFCSRIAIMLRGEIVEQGTPAEVFAAPSHAYTRALIAAIPVLTEAEEALKPTVTEEERAAFLVPTTTLAEEDA
ncbi:ATP-binding cassette domain-containing protein [Pseudoroseicyclus tamaricis]|uniref:ABC transporter ATP-binding protein n=1 Tax=Pseudoroseicyclus tamaricis TaxID=2705421 RepID=A0A6B2JFL2_9RHOB|nr:ABC transporter ATP-binding protein [Pseudoroseicyclus tamaricis]NDU99840.1 ABC transporter ATP-binding protein [Pseudoroseicyclus tamaricis]